MYGILWLRSYLRCFFLPKPLTFNLRFNLIDYTIEKSENKKKVYSIEISEERFSDWLTEYRASVAKRDSENAEEDDGGGWERA